ncbi:MAG TPA: PP2C family protein-serine/threonine phosphatase [Streptosporangiaceae bacterium]
MVAFVPYGRQFRYFFCADLWVRPLPSGGQVQNRYSFGIMVSSSGRRSWSRTQAAAMWFRGLVRRQFITRNRRIAFVLAVMVAGIGIAAVQVGTAWFSPGLMILPVLAGGLLLWPRALCILFGIVAVMLAYDVVRSDERAGFGIVATIVITAVFAFLLARARAKLGLLGLRGDQMLMELRDRIRAQSALPKLPEGWASESVLRPAGGASFGGDFVVSVCDGKTLEIAVVDVSGKGIDAGTRALLLSGAFGGLLGSVPASEFLSSCNAYLRRSEPAEGFVTAVHLALDLTTGNYVVASAGHPPAAHFDSGSGVWRLTQARGIVLGVVPDLRQDVEHGALRPGDALILYTDGLVEMPGRDIDVGIDRLLGEADRLVAGGFGGRAPSLVQAMQDGSSTTDDCGLVLVWRETSAR